MKSSWKTFWATGLILIFSVQAQADITIDPAVDTAEQLGQPGEQGAQFRRDALGAGERCHLLGECGEGLFGLHAAQPSQLPGERSVHGVGVWLGALKPPRAR